MGKKKSDTITKKVAGRKVVLPRDMPKALRKQALAEIEAKLGEPKPAEDIEFLGGVQIHCSKCPEPHGAIVLGRDKDGDLILQMRHMTGGVSTAVVLPADIKELAEILAKHAVTH